MKHPELSNLALSDLLQQLALLLAAGVTVSDAVYLLSDEEKDPDFQQILKEIAESLELGTPLGTAFKEAGCFPDYVTGLLTMGDHVGRTEETLTALSRYYEEKERMNRQLRNALTYPAILLLMMLVVIVVLLSRVLPVFEEVYASLGGSLTGLAGGLLNLGNALNAILPLLGGLLGLIALVVLVFSLSAGARRKASRLFQKIWGDKGIARKMNDARFAQALAMALSSGLPLEDGVSLAGDLLQSSPKAAARCRSCREHLDKGEDLATAMRHSDMLPPSACRMLTLGLRAGTGDVTMGEIARRLTEDAQDSLEAKVAQIEPALVLITSVLVGAILLSVMLPLMNIMKAIG